MVKIPRALSRPDLMPEPEDSKLKAVYDEWLNWYTNLTPEASKACTQDIARHWTLSGYPDVKEWQHEWIFYAVAAKTVYERTGSFLLELAYKDALRPIKEAVEQVEAEP